VNLKISDVLWQIVKPWKMESINFFENCLIVKHWSYENTNWLKKIEIYLNAFSVVLVDLGNWLVLDGILRIVKYPKQSFPDHLIKVIRATVGIIMINKLVFGFPLGYTQFYPPATKIFAFFKMIQYRIG
jgi:hypothetical protein